MARFFKPTRKAPLQSREATPKTLHIESLSLEGRGIARYDGKTVFVRGGLPGEEVEVIHYRRNKRFSECEAREIQVASPWRREPVCPHFGQCGGCQLQHLEPTQQVVHKQQQILEFLSRQHGIEPAQQLEPMTSADVGYRSRVRLGIDGERRLAFREEGSDNMVAITTCPILHPDLQALLPSLQGWLEQLPDRHGVTHIECFVSDDVSSAGLRDTAVVVRHIKALPTKLRQQLAQSLPGSVCLFQGEKGGEFEDAEGQLAEVPLLSLSLPMGAEQAVTLHFAPGDFTQVNRAINPQMVSQALEWLSLTPADRVADLFCGIGNFAIPMAKTAEYVLGVEGVGAMVGRAEHNGALNGTENVHFIALDLESQRLAEMLARERISKVLLDPPRNGAKFICEQLAQSAVQSVVYVSCNPASFARDAAILQAGGCRLQSMRVLDMFPHTAHVEVMALFVRGSARQQ